MVKSNIGAIIKCVTGNVGYANAGAVRNGTSIDRLGYESCVVYAKSGTVAGTPTSYLATITVLHSTGSTTPAMSFYATVGSLASTVTTAELDLKLNGAHRYIQIQVATPVFTGGTSPSVVIDSTVVLGGANVCPAA